MPMSVPFTKVLVDRWIGNVGVNKLIRIAYWKIINLLKAFQKKENNSLLFAECRLAVVWEGGGRDAETIYSTSPSPKLSQISETSAHIPNRIPVFRGSNK